MSGGFKKSSFTLVLNRFARIALALSVAFFSSATIAHAGIWGFGTSGQGQNPFQPRGFMVNKDGKTWWLSSQFRNSGGPDQAGGGVEYVGSNNGLDYIPATPPSGGTWEFYAQTDRNPTPGKSYLAVYKNGVRIDLASYTGAPSRDSVIDPDGYGGVWVIPISNFELDPGTQYQFFFLRGMQANNGITLALAPGTTPEQYLGYYQNPSGAELDNYNTQKYNEYEFIRGWQLDPNTGEYVVNFIPMRYTVQTYASLEAWTSGRAPAQAFLDSVTEADYNNGNYRRENVEALQSLLVQLDDEAQNTVSFKLQPAANTEIDRMLSQLNALLERAKSERVPESDLTAFLEKLTEAQQLYTTAKDKVGIEVGQYGIVEVQQLKNEIDTSSSVNKFTLQQQVDERTAALQQAITAVQLSRVQEDSEVFFDRATGIYVIVPKGALPQDAVLNVIRVGTGEVEYQEAMTALGSEDLLGILYKIQFYSKEKPVSPSETVTVQMPIDENISPTNSGVYRFADRQVAPLTTALAGTYRVFKVDDLGAFLLAGTQATPEEKEATNQQNKENAEAKTTPLVSQTNSSDPTDTQTNALASKEEQKTITIDPVKQLLEEQEALPASDLNVTRSSDSRVLMTVALALVLLGMTLALRAAWGQRWRDQESYV